ncbi:4-hydroxyphenylpyruvate dioxygenase-like protein [Octopus sinensis]|uniref:4-hydroxyphenylpyruvate dioxygenase-like protein n=1 Tax=Octopus sinensis TaxID=2607531 RepID=A0A6P7T7U7_9MOLL|nr:4-hydroxyphenylpyruvate dioxygenase-like protein [Octopus sinensis]
MLQHSIHHIEIGVRENGEEFVLELCKKLGLYRAGYRETVHSRQWLVRANDWVQLLVTEIRSSPPEQEQQNCAHSDQQRGKAIANDPYLVLWDQDVDEGGRPVRNSVFNVCLTVKDIQRQVERLERCGAKMEKPVTVMSDADGEVKVAMVRSCLGNVVHTLVERQHYSGFFLPGFTSIRRQDVKTDDGYEIRPPTPPRNRITHVDHVTFAVEVDTSQDIIAWYENAFGMKRFYVNSAEDDGEGFVINLPNMALRLKAFEYWKCAETGVSSNTTLHHHSNGDVGVNDDDDDGCNKLLFVIAESLKDSEPNQVDTFLKDHKGPGIQHVALHTGNIVDTVSRLKQQGLQFVDPPHTYYKEINGMLKDLNMKESVSRLEDLGILVDVEYGNDKNHGDKKAKYLLQKFTKPIFEVNTFFFEIIQRMGATGFGANNIIALWRSLQTLLQTEQQQQHDV